MPRLANESQDIFISRHFANRYDRQNMNISVIDESHQNSTAGQLKPSLDGHYVHLTQDITILVLYAITTIIGFFGNSIVVYVVFTRKISTTTYILIGNLAISDILGAITTPLQWLFCSTYVLDNYGDRGCGLMKSSQILSYYVSTFTMTVIAFDRYRIVHYPLATRMKPWWPITLIWVISTLFVLPTMISMRISEYFTPKRLIYCRIVFPSSSGIFMTGPFRKIRSTFVVVTQYVIPSVISVVLYALCLKKLILRKRIGAVTDQQSKEFYRTKWRTIKMLSIALWAFIMAWLPVHVMHFIDFYITPLLAKECNSSIPYLFFYWLAISTCCFNPFIYCYLNKDFRLASKAVLCCAFGTNSEQTHELISGKSSRTSRLSSNTGSAIFYINFNENAVNEEIRTNV